MFSSVSMNSVASSALSHGTCASMTTQVGSAVAAKYAAPPAGHSDRMNYGSLDRNWDSLGRRSTISGYLSFNFPDSILLIRSRLSKVYFYAVLS